MKIICDKTLEQYRYGPCEHCGRVTRTHPHHLYAKGHGGGRQIDHYWNLCALCPDCHRRHHDGNSPVFHTLLDIVAARENATPDDIEAFVYLVRRLPKGSPVPTPARSGTGGAVPDDHHGGGQRPGDDDVQGVPHPGVGGQEGVAADEADGGWCRL